VALPSGSLVLATGTRVDSHQGYCEATCSVDVCLNAIEGAAPLSLLGDHPAVLMGVCI
jgi:hypothetical protein